MIWDNGIYEGYGYSLNSIHACDSTAWAVGNYGLIVKYTSQNQWQTQTSVTDLPLNKIFFSDEQHGWITGGDSYWWSGEELQSILLKTVDGGKSWKEKQFDKEIINDMYFADSLHGWAIGEDTTQSYLKHNSGIILETFDGGEYWIPAVENLSARLKAIHFKDGYGLILRTEDGLTWINQNTGKEYPSKFRLSQNYPNPFNPITKINYELPITNYVDLSIYNLLGEKVTTIVNEKQAAGRYQVQWDAAGFASGIYYYRIEAGEFQDVKKMILLR
jgi:hypothetical protein